MALAINQLSMRVWFEYRQTVLYIAYANAKNCGRAIKKNKNTQILIRLIGVERSVRDIIRWYVRFSRKDFVFIIREMSPPVLNRTVKTQTVAIGK